MNLKKIIPVLILAMSTSLIMPAFAGNETPVTTTENTNANSPCPASSNQAY